MSSSIGEQETDVDKLDSPGATPPTPSRQRISRACDHCNFARRKCDGRKPCAYCIRRSIYKNELFPQTFIVSHLTAFLTISQVQGVCVTTNANRGSAGKYLQIGPRTKHRTSRILKFILSMQEMRLRIVLSTIPMKLSAPSISLTFTHPVWDKFMNSQLQDIYSRQKT
jgi:hypothetical protein